jgi:hypothetical protein
MPTIAPAVAMTATFSTAAPFPPMPLWAASDAANALAFCARTRLAARHLRRRAKEKRWSTAVIVSRIVRLGSNSLTSRLPDGPCGVQGEDRPIAPFIPAL